MTEAKGGISIKTFDKELDNMQLLQKLQLYIIEIAKQNNIPFTINQKNISDKQMICRYQYAVYNIKCILSMIINYNLLDDKILHTFHDDININILTNNTLKCFNCSKRILVKQDLKYYILELIYRLNDAINIQENRLNYAKCSIRRRQRDN